THVLKGANWDKGRKSPLTEVGVNVAEGEFIVAVNGRPTSEMANVYESLVNTDGRQVTLKVNKTPEEKGSREVGVAPIANGAGAAWSASAARCRSPTAAT